MPYETPITQEALSPTAAPSPFTRRTPPATLLRERPISARPLTSTRPCGSLSTEIHIASLLETLESDGVPYVICRGPAFTDDWKCAISIRHELEQLIRELA